MSQSNVTFSLDASQRQVYRRYAALALPRHTSYPIAPAWSDDYRAASFREDLRRRPASEPISLYVHVPFCEQLCYYCACTKEIVPLEKHQRQDPAPAFFEGIRREARLLTECLGTPVAKQVHLGGGSPTFLSPEQLTQLWETLSQSCRIADDAEIAVEVDPRITTPQHLAQLRALGFNRISLGVQDFDPKVQQAVNRLQSFKLVEAFMGECRSQGFDSINFDLIYGLPFQTLESMESTLEKTIRLSPDRIAFYRLAVIPEIFRWQNVFKRSDMPAGELPLELNLMAINRFSEAGYEFIGLDHFAKPTEQLAAARREGSLRRNFQGMTTHQELDVVGLGPSAISQLDGAFAQNVKESGDWRSRLDADLATERGLRLSDDDRLRRELMQQLYGFGVIEKDVLGRRFAVEFDAYFSDELVRLADLVDEGLVELAQDAVRLTSPLGRLLVRVVAAVFDKYLPADAYLEGMAAGQSSKVG